MGSIQFQESMVKNWALINCFNDAVLLFKNGYLVDSNSFLEANNAAVNLFGYSRSEFQNLSLKDIFHPLTYVKIQNAKNLTRASEGFCVNKAGQTMAVEFYSNCIDPDENIFMMVIADITEKRKNEEQLSRYLEELHENKDLMEKNAYELVVLNLKLEESEERLKELNASKDKFFSIIAHDLKSPFTSFLGLTELLAEDIGEMDIEEVKILLLELNQNAQNVYSLLENLLSWSRVQTGRMDFSPEIISPFEVEEKISSLFGQALAQKGISYTSSVAASQLMYADRNMVETVLRNLVSNAIKFTHSGDEIMVAASDKGDFVEFMVKDSGVGIDEDNMKKLFRIDKSHTTLGTNNEKGTGLGLTLCKELIERCHGTIRVESKAGEGTSFFFTVPVKDLNSN